MVVTPAAVGDHRSTPAHAGDCKREEVVVSAPTYTPPPRPQAGQPDYSLYDDAHGQGLVTFAGVMLMIAGVLNTLYGIAAIDSSYPILAMVILPLDILAIWGLLWYGGRRRAFREAQRGTAR